MREKKLTVERVRQLLAYDPATGIFTWLVKRNGRNGGVRPGDVAGWSMAKGYLVVGVDGAIVLAHRLAWFYTHGCWPAHQIDHRNRIKTDNRLENLRDVPSAVNMQNLSQRSDNALGLGVTKFRGGYRAQICVGGKRKYLGTHATPELARAAYAAAKPLYHPEASA